MQFNARRHMAVCGCAHGVEENLVALQMIDTRRLRAIEPAEDKRFLKVDGPVLGADVHNLGPIFLCSIRSVLDDSFVLV